VPLRHLSSLIQLARPEHWIKNLFVLAVLVFARKIGDAGAWLASLGALAAFCLASSAVYAINDVTDRREDAEHPEKRRRPVASGDIGVRTALVFGVVLAAAALLLALAVGPWMPVVVGAYLVLMAGYTFGLKRIAILDVLLIASGFVIRAYAGGVALDVEVSHWLLLCTLTLALFLGFAKREAERVALGAAAAETRLVEWRIYDGKSLEHMMTVSAALAVVTYMLYTVSERTEREVVGNYWLFVTVLPVVYAVFRFYSRVIAGGVSGPVDMIRRDRPFLAALAVWVLMVALVLALSRPVPPGGPQGVLSP
jgi:4-hydroxybenzoate polyprenyltransferase